MEVQHPEREILGGLSHTYYSLGYLSQMAPPTANRGVCSPKLDQVDANIQDRQLWEDIISWWVSEVLRDTPNGSILFCPGDYLRLVA